MLSDVGGLKKNDLIEAFGVRRDQLDEEESVVSMTRRCAELKQLNKNNIVFVRLRVTEPDPIKACFAWACDVPLSKETDLGIQSV